MGTLGGKGLRDTNTHAGEKGGESKNGQNQLEL